MNLGLFRLDPPLLLPPSSGLLVDGVNVEGGSSSGSVDSLPEMMPGNPILPGDSIFSNVERVIHMVLVGLFQTHNCTRRFENHYCKLILQDVLLHFVE